MSSNPSPGIARRGFIAGAVLAIPAAAIAPTALLASSDADPIFALIEAHRTAEKAHSAAYNEQARRERILIDEGIGLCPFVVMVCNDRPIVAHSHEQIDAYAGSVSQPVASRAHTELDATLERYHAVLGNIDNEAGELGHAGLDAFYDMISAVPTTARGSSVLLKYLTENFDNLGPLFNEDNIEALLITISDALQALHPAT